MNDVDKVIAPTTAMAPLSFSLGTFRSDYKSQLYYKCSTPVPPGYNLEI
jgi:hypothetical protein